MKNLLIILAAALTYTLPLYAQRIINLPAQFDTSSIKGTKGYFRVAKTAEGKWWFLTPANEPFFYKGVCAVNRAGTAGGRNALPGAYALTVDRKYDYQKSPDKFVQASLKKIRSLGFNALGAWTTEEFFNQGMPFTEILEFFKEPPFLPVSGDKPLPDIFDPLWETAIDKKARALCSPLRDSKDLVGYFTDNEIGFGNADDSGFDPGFKSGQLNVALLRTLLAIDTAKSASKYAWHFIRNRYASNKELSAAWEVNASSYKDIERLNSSGTHINSKAYQEDAAAFVKQYAMRYFELAYKAIKRHDPNHLLLGCRFGNLPPNFVLDAIRPWTDVISANNYRPTLYERYDTLYRYTGLPLLIGEFSWNTGLFKKIPFPDEKTAPLSESERMFRTGKQTLARAARHDGIIGFTWYRWVQGSSTTTKFYDGIVDYNDEFDMHASVLKDLLPVLDSIRFASVGNRWKTEKLDEGELILFPENLKPGWDQYIRVQIKKGKAVPKVFGWQLNGDVVKMTSQDDSLKLLVNVNFETSPATGKSLYELRLRRKGEIFYGTFSGFYNGQKQVGKLKAFYFPEFTNYKSAFSFK